MAVAAQGDPGAVEARAAVLRLLAARAPTATICPSEVVRVLAGGGDWRGAMPVVHAAVDGLVAEGLVRLSWKGAGVPARGGIGRYSFRAFHRGTSDG